jgi:RNA polymerase sigma-70 factor (ECF subfamily)
VSPADGSFEAFYAEHFEALYRGLAVAFGNPLLAEEAAQEAFARAYTRWDRVHDIERPAAWMYVVAVRIARRRRRDLLDLGRNSHPQNAIGLRTLPAAIDALPPRQRIALVLHHYAALPSDDIARAIGRTADAAKSTLNAAHTRLHVDIDDDEIPEVELDAP